MHHDHTPGQSPCPVLREGSSGPAVRNLQHHLIAAGFNPGKIDGIFGPMTRAAVIAFQGSMNLVQDGIVGIKTWTALGVNCHIPPVNHCPTLAIGSSGPAVVKLQGLLKTRGFYTGNVDGIFGPITRAAVISFQGSMCLVQDGIVGIKTWTALGVNCF
ncbi:peptidoglycan-binding protein [Desulfosporosinus sp. Sb-LF]|uniref:peptidoglycan-binding domain-containing protein n=1 Tax=Desulfosporosinus sp. Sb-LF TaxID=2560027 RepID=UPI00107EEF06|nr:peptidoglycan-binding protein [Desulfosporosinus sp. Sb-LF]TGE33389.1 peptidoglycan-binding protein [Desulfosporosinus sp. Sb-LF]